MKFAFGRQDINEILDVISPVLKRQFSSSDGIQARFFNVDNFDYISDKIGNIYFHEISINFGTDQGTINQNIIIKQFTFLEDLEREVDMCSHVETTLLEYRDLNLFPKIYTDKSKLYIVYNTVPGYHVDQLLLPEEGLNFLMGRVHAAIHGNSILKTDENVVREYILFLLIHMPLTDEEREAFSYLLEEQFEKISVSKGSFEASFAPGISNLVFHPTGEPANILNIKKGSAFSVYIGPRISENLMRDRMFDIAGHFAEKAFEEYKKTDDVYKTKLEMSTYVQGYLDCYYKLRNPEFKELYANGIPLDLYIMTHLWLTEAEKVRSPYIEPDLQDDREILFFSYYLMTEQPFQYIFG